MLIWERVYTLYIQSIYFFQIKMFQAPMVRTAKTKINLFIFYVKSTISRKATLSFSFLSSPLAGKRDIVVTILVRCMCVRQCVHASVRPSGFVRTITCTIMHGFQNNLAQLLPLRRRSVF